MIRRNLALALCILMFVSLIPCVAFAAEDYDTVTIEKGNTVLNLLEARGGFAIWAPIAAGKP